MLQRARRMKSDAPAGFSEPRLEAAELGVDHFADIARQSADFRSLRGVAGIALEQVPVFLHGDAATARRHDDRFHAVLDVRPPGIDERTHVVQAVLLIVQVVAQGAAAAGAFGFDERNADAVEHARCGGVDIGRERRLHAAREREHFPGVPRRRPGARTRRRGRDCFREPGRKIDRKSVV